MVRRDLSCVISAPVLMVNLTSYVVSVGETALTLLHVGVGAKGEEVVKLGSEGPKGGNRRYGREGGEGVSGVDVASVMSRRSRVLTCGHVVAGAGRVEG